jgi:hypothetical protein
MDFTHKQALHDMRVRRYGQEVTNIMEDYADMARREAREHASAVTPDEIKAGQTLERNILRDITGSGGDGNLPPSIAKMYHDYAETQQKQDSTFCIPGYQVGVQLNPDDSVTLVNCTNITTDMACQVASIILALDNLLDLTEPTSPYDATGYGMNAVSNPYQRKQSTYERVEVQFRRLKRR